MAIELVSVIFLFNGEELFLLSAIDTDLLKMRKSVITRGGSKDDSFILSGKNSLKPLRPPKYIAPERLLQYACLNSLDCNPSATVKFLNVLFLGLNFESPLLVLIHKFSLSSFKIPYIFS